MNKMLVSLTIMSMMYVSVLNGVAQNNEYPNNFSCIQRNDTLFISGETTLENQIERIGSETRISYNVPSWGFKADEYEEFVKMTQRKNTLVINEGMKTIKEGAFAVFQIISVTIPSSVTSIEDRAFYHCDELKAYNVDAANKNYSSLDGVLYNYDKTILLACPNGKAGKCTIPASVTSIAGKAFNDSRYNSKLSDIYVNWITPPVIDKNNGFFDFPKTTCLHIPAGTKNNYKAAGWNKFFKKIVETR
jgi:hypothetical protein